MQQVRANLILDDCIRDVLRKSTHCFCVSVIFLVPDFTCSFQNRLQFALDSFESSEVVLT